ncbi:MAG: SPASM domain-containing protein [Bacteroidales bacterium]|jgi:uncharacterized protein|nr:SPASM domain-containing protein [Bacteroidales bacterium]
MLQDYECMTRPFNSYFISAEVGLYKCWENIEHENTVVEKLNNDESVKITNELIYTRYLRGADYIENQDCLNCFFFPICEGACPDKRLRNQFSDACFDLCIGCKDNIEEMLDNYYELKKRIIK